MLFPVLLLLFNRCLRLRSHPSSLSRRYASNVIDTSEGRSKLSRAPRNMNAVRTVAILVSANGCKTLVSFPEKSVNQRLPKKFKWRRVFEKQWTARKLDNLAGISFEIMEMHGARERERNIRNFCDLMRRFLRGRVS